MTIDKAIEILRNDIDSPGSVAIEDINEAEQLGIEALHRCQELKKYTARDAYIPLPGETK